MNYQVSKDRYKGVSYYEGALIYAKTLLVKPVGRDRLTAKSLQKQHGHVKGNYYGNIDVDADERFWVDLAEDADDDTDEGELDSESHEWVKEAVEREEGLQVVLDAIARLSMAVI